MADVFQQLSPAQQQKFLEGPGLESPNDEYDFDHPPNQNGVAYAVLSICLVVSALSIFLRLYARVFYLKKLEIPDYLMIVAFATFTAFCGCCYRLTVSIGFFVHQWNVQAKNLIDFSYLVFVGVNVYDVTLMCLKVAILLDWLRILVPQGKRNHFYWTSLVTMVVNICWYCAGIIRQNLTCIPHSKIWDFTIPDGHCFNNTKWWIATASVNLVSDIVILLLPHTIIWSLQLSKAKKTGVSMVFAIGVLTCAAAIWRLAATVAYVNAEDQTYKICSLILSISVEILFIFMVLCVPSIPLIVSRSPFLSRMTSSLRLWSTSSMVGKSAGFSDSGKPRSHPSAYQNIDDGIPLHPQPMGVKTPSASTSAKNFSNDDIRRDF